MGSCRPEKITTTIVFALRVVTVTTRIVVVVIVIVTAVTTVKTNTVRTANVFEALRTRGKRGRREIRDSGRPELPQRGHRNPLGEEALRGRGRHRVLRGIDAERVRRRPWQGVRVQNQSQETQEGGKGGRQRQSGGEDDNDETANAGIIIDGNQNDVDNNNLARTMMVLIFAVASLSSLDRVAMSVSIVPMSLEMGFSDSVKGSISSFFSVGYGLGILPAGLLVSRLSPRLMLGLGICLWSFGTIATPFTIAQGNVSLLLGARALVGASESVVVPSIQRLLSRFAAPEKKSFAVATVFCGFQFGTILAYSLSPLVIDYFSDWRSVFTLYGGAGLVFLVPWLLYSKDSPIPSIEEQIEIDAKQILRDAPWREFIQSRGVLAMLFAHAANNWGLYNNLSWTPTFYAEQYGMNIKESALLLVVPSIAGAIGGLTAGSIADSIIQNLEIVTDDEITRIRRSFQALGLLGPAFCMTILASSIPEEPWVAQTLFAVAVGFQSFNAAGYGAANQEKSGPKWTGLLYSITSLPSVIVGTFGVYLTGKILDSTDQNWSYVFGLNAFVYALGGIAFATLYDSRKEFD